jgi:hypothetical protein
MKEYVVPTLMYVNLRVEERIAVSGCTGSCSQSEADEYNKGNPGATPLVALGTSS